MILVLLPPPPVSLAIEDIKFIGNLEGIISFNSVLFLCVVNVELVFPQVPFVLKFLSAVKTVKNSSSLGLVGKSISWAFVKLPFLTMTVSDMLAETVAIFKL